MNPGRGFVASGRVRARALIVTALAAIAMPGCEALVPEGPGIIDVRIQDDSLPHPDVPSPLVGVSGNADVQAFLEIRDSTGVWHPLGWTSGPLVDLQLPAPRSFVGPRALPESGYNALRVSGFSALVTIPAYNLQSLPVTVSSSFVLPFNWFGLETDESRFIVIVLNVEKWATWGPSTTMVDEWDVIDAIFAYVNGPTP